MTRFRDRPYRTKLLMTHLGCVLLTALVIGGMVAINTSNQMRRQGVDNLRLLTEQMAFNFTKEVHSAERYLYAMGVSTNTARLMGRVDPTQMISKQEYLTLVYGLSKMVDSHAPYDFIAVRLKNGDIVCSNSYLPYDRVSKTLLSIPENTQVTYGKSIWARTEDGEVYLIRDVYDTSPLRHVGKMCAHIRQDDLITMDNSNVRQDGTVLFFDAGGTLAVTVGERSDELEAAAAALLESKADLLRVGADTYSACVLKRQGWTVVGVTPLSALHAAQRSVLLSGMLAALLGMAAGTLAAIAVSGQLSRQINRLVVSMNRVEKGDLNVVLPVRGKDEIGVLTDHFNEMTAKIRDLLSKVVQEENSKRQAEYMNLEYEYRFLQWQVNPHFIYNALETINALAKLDGNAALSDMIVLLSDYFRQNAEAMREKFVEVSQEFRSLKQYAQIYASIYGSALNVRFDIAPEAEKAFVPTMMIQPLLENALVHGASAASETTVHADASVVDGRIVIRIRDTGFGMTRETIDRILGRSDNAGQPVGANTSLGVRNVLDRMHLLYGDEARMEIESETGKGTCVSVSLPLTYEDQSEMRLSRFRR